MHARSSEPSEATPGRASDRIGWRWLLVGAAVVAFLVLTLWRLHLPGLYYDEVLFVNAALGGEDETFLRARLFGIPLAVMSYIGALKSWVHAPVFWLLEVSPGTLRIPSVILSAVTLVWLWRLGCRLFGPALATALAIVLATDPAFVLQARMDHGPTVLMLLTKTAALWFLVQWLSAPRAALLWGVVISLSFGLFDKLNFVWFVIALGFATLLVWPRELRRAFATTGKWGVPPVAFFAIVLAAAGAHSLRLMMRHNPYDSGGLDASLLERVPWMLDLWHATANGSAYHRFVFAEAIPTPSWVILGTAVGVLAFVAARARPSNPRTAPAIELPRTDLFFLALLAVLFALMVATPQARGGHHALMAWPFHWLFAFAAIARLLDAQAPDGRRRTGVALATLAVVLVGSQVRAVTGFIGRLDAPSAYRAVWSPSSYALADRLAAEPAEVVLSIDWGLHNQLFALAPAERRALYDDVWQPFFHLEQGTKSAEEIYERYFRGRRVAAVLFAPEHAARPSARETFLQFAAGYLEQVAEPELVRDASGRALFEIHRVRG